MPGIVGIFGEMGRDEAMESLVSMLEAMDREPFHRQGFHYDSQLGVYLGWSVHKDSCSDCLPIKNEEGTVLMVLSGEVFTPPERLRWLRERGHRFEDGDASHLVHLYEESGERFLQELNGTYTGAVLDERKGCLLVFNDRLGFEKLYLHEPEPGSLFFASEAKSLLRRFHRLREFEPDGLAQFLSLGSTLETTTLFRGISLLPPAASWLLSRRQSIEKRIYFQPNDWEVDTRLGPKEFEESFKSAFRELLPRYFDGRLSAGLSLTGGWDTRMIMAGRRPVAGTLPCYTFAGLSGDTVDVRQARKVAAAAGQEHKVLRLQSDFLTEFPEHAQRTVSVSDGLGSVGLSHEVYLNRQARSVAGCRLTGNFGSEVLRGMSTFKALPLRLEVFPKELRTEMARCKQHLQFLRAQSDGTRFAIFGEIPWKLSTTVRLANSQLPTRSPFLDNQILRLACTSSVAVQHRCFLPVALIRDDFPELLGIPTDRGCSGKPPTALGSLRRVWYAGTFKLDYLLNEGMSDFLLRAVDAFGGPRLLPLRHKYLAYRRWLRGPLRGFVEGTLAAGGFASGLCGRDVVSRVIRNHISGARNELATLDSLLTLELTNRLLLRPQLERGPNANTVRDALACVTGGKT